jgi:hypothetical protein
MPVHFACPQCRQLLKISRRKIGSICECPRCGSPTAVPEPTTIKRELAHSSSSRLEGVAGGAVTLFDDVNELLAQGPTRPAAVGSDSADDTRRTSRTAAADPRWSQPVDSAAGSSAGAFLFTSRTRIFVQCGLFSMVAAAAFVAGYVVGHGRAATIPSTAAATVTTAPQPADWPTPAR